LYGRRFLVDKKMPITLFGAIVIYFIIFGLSFLWLDIRFWRFTGMVARIGFTKALKVWNVQKNRAYNWICAFLIICIIITLMYFCLGRCCRPFMVPFIPIISAFYLLYICPFLAVRNLMCKLKISKATGLIILTFICIIMMIGLYLYLLKGLPPLDFTSIDPKNLVPEPAIKPAINILKRIGEKIGGIIEGIVVVVFGGMIVGLWSEKRKEKKRAISQ